MMKSKLNIKVNSAIAITQYINDKYQVQDPIKLQKLLFFLTLESLKQKDCLLFSESFEAWIYGPVIPEVYRYFHYSQINHSDSQSLSFVQQLRIQEKEFIDQNIHKYLKFSTLELRNWAHEMTPWINARAGYDERERSRQKIKVSTLRNYAHSSHFQWETFCLDKENDD